MFVRTLLLGLALVVSLPLRAAAPTPDGLRLSRFLDATHVEERWPAGVHVAWETGLPDGKPEKNAGRHTHCSAFVASVAKQLGVYILRPPEHGQALLANAQYDWLAGAGAAQGWHGVPTGAEAQEAANRGELVVATYRNHRDDKPGHIAIVRPSSKTLREIETDGPEITQAGGTNYLGTTLKRGFAGHPAAWDNAEVRYYAHAIDWSRWPRR
ncbi:MAG TPA: hypothetical protein VKB52_15580 [Rhodanobacteraceae bacterium]|nr:hypothetical protein [Rhodanobacteraceae bacterium]